jgi:two-component system sensor histidine kinase PilS (NtrC family)
MAHEIRNPLAAISGSIQLLEGRVGRAPDEAESRRLMRIVLRETDRLNHLLTDFLLYACPGPLRREPVALALGVEELLEMFERVRPPEVSVELRIEPGAAVYADPQRLRQLLWNLVRNAAEAMPAGGRLLIAARRIPAAAPQDRPQGRRNEERGKSGWVEISVGDEGAGIAPEIRERIFDPFFTTKRGGSGLGLAAVHRIVEDHGGSIRLDSEPGRGTVVRLRLPGAE